MLRRVCRCRPRWTPPQRGVATQTTTSKQFLEQHPRGAYTTARTVGGGTAVFELDAHVSRTAASLRLMHEDGGSALEAALEPARFREGFVRSVAASVESFKQTAGGEPTEVRVTLLAVWQGSALDFYCHAGKLPPPPSAPVVVEVRGSPRSAASAKDSAWVAQRQGLEQLRGAGVDEVILRGAGGELLEGSQTNFYAVRDGAVWTAADGVLEGTVRSLVLRVCAEQRIDVVLEPPNLRDLDEWEGCLISSTSRLLLPIDTVRVCREGAVWDAALDRSRSFGADKEALTSQLAKLVAEAVAENSLPLREDAQSD